MVSTRPEWQVILKSWKSLKINKQTDSLGFIQEFMKGVWQEELAREPDEHLEINPLNLEITSLQIDARFPPASTLSNSKTHQHQGSRAARETANLVQQGG